ncbi:MAG: hypothetical protein IBJ15_20030 [Alphaproteobacteria bacterium]|nr:hypothetical protein [Alphaproteobacteria bacterium]
MKPGTGLALNLPAEGRRHIAAACPSDLEIEFLDPDFKTPERLGALEALVVGTQPVPEALLDAAPRLRLIQRWGTGRDNIDVVAVERRGVATAELPGANTRSVSEFLLLAILSALRHLPDIAVAWSRGTWLTARPGFPHRRLTGKTIGLLGFGAIGRDLTNLLAPFDVRVTFHDLRRPDGVSDAIRGPLSIDEIMASADIVCVSLPSNAGTRGAVDAAQIARMKRGAVLLSIARADVVDERAARDAVRDGRLAAASFDNFTVEPLPKAAIAHQPGVLATPHIGGASIEGFEALTAACFASIAAKLKNLT